MTNPQPKPDDTVDGPAIITDLHKQDRPATDENGKAVTGTAAWRKLTPLQACYLKQQLEGGNHRYNALQRLDAGLAYSAIFDATERGGTDSTQALNVSRSSARGFGNDATERAWDDRLAIESHLGRADRTIIRMVCGEACKPVEAIRAACGGDYKHTIADRFREALDNLIEARETARRHPKIFNMERRA